MLFSCSNQNTKLNFHNCEAFFANKNLRAYEWLDLIWQLWDVRIRAAQKTLKTAYPILATCFSGDDLQVFSAGIDEAISVWDLRSEKLSQQLMGHADSVTGVLIQMIYS